MDKFDKEKIDKELKEALETSERLEKNLKRGVFNDLKKLLLIFGLLLSLFLFKNIIPVSFVPYFSLIVCISTAVLATVFSVKKLLKNDEIIEHELDIDMNNLSKLNTNKSKKNGINKVNNIKKSNNKFEVKNESKNKSSFITNQLSNCIELQYFGEYIEGLLSFLREEGKIKSESLEEEVIEQFISPIENILGDNVKIITTFDLEADIIVKMNNKSNNINAVSYLYDGENFYIYRPSKNAVTLLPIRNIDMYNVFVSNDENLKNRSLVQFFTDIYGDIEDRDDNKKIK